jgi:hypothetical protein
VFQAIATLAFVQVVMALALYSDNLTGGAMGLNAIPNLVGTVETLVSLLLVHALPDVGDQRDPPGPRLRGDPAERGGGQFAGRVGRFHQAVAFASAARSPACSAGWRRSRASRCSRPPSASRR